MATRQVVTFDIETDPFQHDQKPAPFLIGFFDGVQFLQFWGDDCIAQFCEYCRAQRPMLMYAHNGGKFDFFFLPLPFEKPKIINGRIAQCEFGKHRLRDSYCILPFALSKYEKTIIDYEKFRRENREAHKNEIMQYHRDDLLHTHNLITSFRERFGGVLTAPGAAIKELLALHPIPKKDEMHDSVFRKYYHGGRVEAIKPGNHKGKWKIYDVNSMYPHAMANFNHPTGARYEFTTDAQSIFESDAPGFATVLCDSAGALPVRAGFRLEFPHGHGEFNCTLHELRAARKLGLIHNCEIVTGYLSAEYSRFDNFVSVFSREKIAAKKAHDKTGELFAKLILNSAYGKLAANPENYFDYQFLMDGENIPCGWELDEDYGWMFLIRRPSPIRSSSYFDVATAASITGAARACLLRALATATEPIYCDTDSIICKAINLPISPTKLGAWKLEGEGDNALIISRKLYCVTQKKELVKSASKGVQLNLQNFVDLLKNGEYTYFRDAPNYKKDGSVKFTKRTVRTNF